MERLPEIVTRSDRSPSWLKRTQQRGLIAGVLPGVYVRSDVAAQPQARARAVMAWRPDAVIGGELAAQLTFWRDIQVRTIDVSTHRTTITRDGFRFHERRIPPQLQGRHGYFQITLPALTALDMCLSGGPDVIDRALRSRLVTVEMLHEALAVTSYRTGNGDRRREVLSARTRPWSAAERIAHDLLAEARIGGWVANQPITLDLWTFYVDIAFTDIKLAVEIDGYEVHSQRDVFESDRERQNDLVLDGWTVLRFTYRQLTQHPAHVIDTVRRGIRVASQLHRPRRATRTRGQVRM